MSGGYLHDPGDRVDKGKLAKQLQQMNEWRQRDTDVASIVLIVLRKEGYPTLAKLALEKPEVFAGLYDSAEQLCTIPELDPDHAPEWKPEA